MNKFRTYLAKISSILFSTKAAGFYLLTFAFAIGIATFILHIRLIPKLEDFLPLI